MPIKLIISLILFSLSTIANVYAKEHKISLSIPAEQAGTSPEGGYVVFLDHVIEGLKSGDRLTISIVFPQPLQVIGRTMDVGLQISMGKSSQETHVVFDNAFIFTEGTLKLNMANGGVRVRPGNVDIFGFWLNLRATSTPQPDQSLKSVTASFEIPTMELTREGDLYRFSDFMVKWSNMTTSPAELESPLITGVVEGIFTLASGIFIALLPVYFSSNQTDLAKKHVPALVAISGSVVAVTLFVRLLIIGHPLLSNWMSIAFGIILVAVIAFWWGKRKPRNLKQNGGI